MATDPLLGASENSRGLDPMESTVSETGHSMGLHAARLQRAWLDMDRKVADGALDASALVMLSRLGIWARHLANDVEGNAPGATDAAVATLRTLAALGERSFDSCMSCAEPQSPAEGLPQWPVAYPGEGDVDLVLVQELTVLPGLRRRFLEHAFGRPFQAHRLVGVWRNHEVGNKAAEPAWSGETDVLLVVEQNGRHVALLMEDKIDAEFQPDQPRRYRRRAENLRERGLWQEYRTMLMTPKRYLETADDTEWDAVLPFETVIGWFDELGTTRAAVQAAILRRAVRIAKPKSPPDGAATAFWAAYTAYAAEHFPALGVPDYGPRSSHDYWPWIWRSADGNVGIQHKENTGTVDLVVRGSGPDTLGEAVLAHLAPGMRVRLAGQSAAITIDVPKVSCRSGFAAQREAVHAALDAATGLLKLYRATGQRIADLVTG